MIDTPGMLVVGAGECGARAVLTLREEGYTGPVSLVGAERHAPYERPPLSKEAMLADVRPEARAVATLALLEETGVTFLSSIEALAIDRDRRSVRLSTGASLPYARLLIATGATPRRLALAERSRRCVYLRTFDDALAIRTHLHAGVRLAVIGGGFIGLELAAAARRLGCAVTVIEAQPRILVRGVPAEIAAALHAEHEAQGALIAVGAAITAIDDTDGAVRISLTSGDDIEADLAIIGIGAVPATRLAETAGLPVDNGITVDDCLRTGDPAIFAAGDCCAFPLPLYGGRRVRLEAWRNAQEQGARAARNMLGAEEPQSAVPWFWSDQYGLGLQITGLPDEGATEVRRDLADGAFLLFHLARDGRLVAASGIGPGNAVARDIRLAEMLIARRAAPPPESLATRGIRLKSLLAA